MSYFNMGYIWLTGLKGAAAKVLASVRIGGTYTFLRVCVCERVSETILAPSVLSVHIASTNSSEVGNMHFTQIHRIHMLSVILSNMPPSHPPESWHHFNDRHHHSHLVCDYLEL